MMVMETAWFRSTKINIVFFDGDALSLFFPHSTESESCTISYGVDVMVMETGLFWLHHQLKTHTSAGECKCSSGPLTLSPSFKVLLHVP